MIRLTVKDLNKLPAEQLMRHREVVDVELMQLLQYRQDVQILIDKKCTCK